MKSIAWAILLATAFSWAEYREIHCSDDMKQGKAFAIAVMILFACFIISLVP